MRVTFGAGLTVRVMGKLNEAGPVHPAVDVTRTCTTSPFCGVLRMKVGEFGPIGLPLRYHWKEGAGPPSVTFAVKVIGVPSHTVVPGTALTVTVGMGLTVMVMALEVGPWQPRCVVTAQVTTSPFAGT